jgi:hypothetical protein
MTVSRKTYKQGTVVRRTEGEGEKERDIGRIGTVQKPSSYNAIGGTMTVLYEATETQPQKLDEHCSSFEFEEAQLEPSQPVSVQ